MDRRTERPRDGGTRHHLLYSHLKSDNRSKTMIKKQTNNCFYDSRENKRNGDDKNKSNMMIARTTERTINKIAGRATIIKTTTMIITTTKLLKRKKKITFSLLRDDYWKSAVPPAMAFPSLSSPVTTNTTTTSISATETRTKNL